VSAPGPALLPGKYTAELARFASELTFSAVPPEVLDRVKYLVLDGVGCGLHGSTLPWSRRLTETVRRLGGPGPASVWASGTFAPADQAALLNGAYVQAFELDDYSPRGSFHACSVVLPAVLGASALRERVTGRDLLAAVIVGFEVGNRVGECLDGARLTRQGWHTGSVIGPIAAAAAAGNLLSITPGQMEHAFGIAATQAGGLVSAQFGSMVKRMHHGRAAQSGLYAAALAGDGYTGISAVFERPYGGYCSTFTGSEDEFDLGALVEGLGQSYRTVETCVKPYACSAKIHVVLDALRVVMSAAQFRPADVAAIRVRAPAATVTKAGWRYSGSGSATEAQMNMGYAVAAMLLEGDVFVGQFRDDMLRDRQVLELASRVSVEAAAPGPGGRRLPVRVEVRLGDGTVLSAERESAHGSAADPLSDRQVLAKYEKLVAVRQRPDHTARVRDLVLAVDTLTDVRTLTDALADA
jgi:aconitate decarboxylase